MRRIFTITFCIALVFILSSCACFMEGIASLNGDWEYKITNDYAIERINFLDISLFRAEANHLDRLLEENVFIQEFCFNKNTVGIKYIILNDSDIHDDEKHIKIQDKTVLYDDTFLCRYMVYDLTEEKILADYDKKEDMEYFCEYNGYITEFDWISTSSKPNGAHW